MLTFVQIKDFVSSKTYQLFFQEDDLSDLDDTWFEDDDLLSRYQTSELFRGRKSLNSLVPIHFKLLISNHVSAGLKDVACDARDAFFDEEHEFLAGLTDLLCGYIRCLQETNGAFVDILTIYILENNKVNFETTLSMSIESINMDRKPSGLKIVVDNTTKTP